MAHGGGKENKTGRQRGGQKKQKSTPNPEAKASGDTVGRGVNSGAQYIQERKSDPSPSTLKASNAGKKPKANYWRKKQNKRQRKKKQAQSSDESEDSSEPEDQGEVVNNGGKQQQAYPPQSKTLTKNVPKNTKKDEPDVKLPAQGGSRGSKKKAAAASNSVSNNNTNANNVNAATISSQKSNKKATQESNLTTKCNPNSNSYNQFNSKKTINEVVNVSGPQASSKKATNAKNSVPPIQKGLQTPRNKVAETNLTNKFDQNKAIKKDVRGYEPPNQKGLQTPGNKVVHDTNLTSKFNGNKGTNKKEVRGSEPPNQRGLQTSGNKGSHEPNKAIIKEVKGYEPPNQQVSRKRGPEPNLTNKIDQSKILKTEVKCSEPPIQRGSQASRKNPAAAAARPTPNATLFYPDKVVREVTNTKLPIQRGPQNSQKMAPEPNIRTRCEPNQIIKNDGGYAQSGSQNYRKNYPGGPQGSKQTAPSKETNSRTFNPNQVPPAAPPIRQRNANQTGPIDPSPIRKADVQHQKVYPQNTNQVIKNNAQYPKTNPQNFPNQYNPNNTPQKVIQENVKNIKIVQQPMPNSQHFHNQMNPNNVPQNVLKKDFKGPMDFQNPRSNPQNFNSQCNPNNIPTNHIKEETKRAEAPRQYLANQFISANTKMKIEKVENPEAPRQYFLNQNQFNPINNPKMVIRGETKHAEAPRQYFTNQLHPINNPQMVVREPNQNQFNAIRYPKMVIRDEVKHPEAPRQCFPNQNQFNAIQYPKMVIGDEVKHPEAPRQYIPNHNQRNQNDYPKMVMTGVAKDAQAPRQYFTNQLHPINNPQMVVREPNQNQFNAIQYPKMVIRDEVKHPEAPRQCFPNQNQFNAIQYPKMVIRDEVKHPEAPRQYFPNNNQFNPQNCPKMVMTGETRQYIPNQNQFNPIKNPQMVVRDGRQYNQLNPENDWNIKKELHTDEHRQYLPTLIKPNNVVKEEVQDSDSQLQLFPNLINPNVIKTEVQDSDSQLQPFPTLIKPNVIKTEVHDPDSQPQFFPTLIKPNVIKKNEVQGPDCPPQYFPTLPKPNKVIKIEVKDPEVPIQVDSIKERQHVLKRASDVPLCSLTIPRKDNDPWDSFNANEVLDTDFPELFTETATGVTTAVDPQIQTNANNTCGDDDMDSGLYDELALLFPDKDPLPEKANEKPAGAGEEEAAIEARLKAELDSLPFVKAPVEDPVEGENVVDNLFNSIMNSSQQTSQPSNGVANQVVPSNNHAPTPSPNVAAKKPLNMANLGAPQRLPQQQQVVARNRQRPMSQVPMVAQVTGLQGQIMSLTYTTAPDGLVTSVSATSADMPHAQVNELQSLTAAQLHQILQSGQPYLALPMIVPGGQEESELGVKDPAGTIASTGQAVEDEEVDYEEIGVADTFAEYWPSKLKFGVAHPDPVVETATLSSVELPDITYKLEMNPGTTSCLSALQLEAVIYACQAHEQILPSGERAGFLLGDGAGVGKGRTIAGIIYDNFLKGRKRALWVSVSNDLKFDAERDLNDIGADDKIRVVPINKFKYSRIDSDDNENFKKGVIFCTYTALIGESVTANSKYKTRLRQLVSWLGKKFDGVIVFDECHKAKNLSLMNVGKSTKTGTTVLELQKLLPQARVVYASATGASEPRNMAYMIRLGLWGPGTAYSEFFEFVNAVEKRGIGAMEIVAMDMKLRGTYIARQLSFKDVTFRIEEVPMSKEFRKTYNLAAELWAEINKKFVKACRLMCIENRVQKIITCQFWCAHQRFFKNLCIASKVHHVVRMTRQATRMGKAVVIGLQSTGESRTLEHLERHNGRLSTFVSTSKMIIQSFVEKHFPAPKRESFHHLLNTGEFEPEPRYRPPRAKKAKMNVDWFDDDMDAEAAESDIEMYESTLAEDSEQIKPGRKRRGRPPKTEKAEKITMQERILQHLCNNMRAQDNDADGTYTFDNTKLQKANITEHDVERCIRARELLLDKIDVLGRRMPSNTLDKLISELGGTMLVAEMTGRRGRVVRTEYDGYKYEPRCEADTTMDLVNYKEKQRFMRGLKFVAIISEAASSGISLQSDKRVSNQRRRLHITLELPWSADRAIQQFGRTHRSNQVNSPEYVFVITDLAGERRFASTVAKRLESLGALTQGDRRATDARDLSQFNIDNSVGRSALENVMQQLTGEKPLDHASVPASYKGDFLYDCSMAMAGVGMLNIREENKVKLFSVEKDSNNISKFLNRILGCRVEVQNALFKFFLDKMYSLILQMKRKGHFDLGILDLDAHGACVKSVKLMRFIRKHATGTAATELHTVTVERGMSFDTALTKYRKESRHDHEGFYVLQQLRHNKNSAIMCLQASCKTKKGSSSPSPNKISLQLYRPNTGPQVRLETLSSILARYVKVDPEVARDFWQSQYDVCLDKCSHIFWNRVCPFPAGCEVGLRVRPYHVLSGLMLPIWDRIEVILAKSGHKIQIIRVKTDVNKKIVGTVVPHGVYDALVADLSADSVVESH